MFDQLGHLKLVFTSSILPIFFLCNLKRNKIRKCQNIAIALTQLQTTENMEL